MLNQSYSKVERWLFDRDRIEKREERRNLESGRKKGLASLLKSYSFNNQYSIVY